MPHNPFPDPAAVLPGEAAMLSAVLANLTDDLPKLVYADWLEERGDPRGVFLRDFTTAVRNGGTLPEADGLSNAWLDLTGCRAVAAARKHGLPIMPDELLKDALPALTFISEPASDDALLIGQSKFGGEPDLPPGFVWPEYLSEPLSFLAQFDLAVLSTSPTVTELPRVGLLSVFYSTTGDVFTTSDVGGWRVFHFPNSGGLERGNLPEVLGSDARFQSCRLTFTETLVLPESREFNLDEHRDAYRNEVSNTHLGHLLLGNPRWIQGEAWLVIETAGASSHRHLLSIDSDHRAGWMWGDTGMLYLGISTEDLKAKRFDRTLFEMQCC